MIKNKPFNLAYLLLFVTLFFVTACDELPCPNESGIQVNMGFYLIENNIISDLFIDSLTIEYLNPNNENVSEFLGRQRQFIEIPLSITSDTSTFVLKFKDDIADTILIKSDRTVKLISHQCGFDTFFDINEIQTSSNKLDSVWLRRDVVDYADFENIKIYF